MIRYSTLILGLLDPAQRRRYFLLQIFFVFAAVVQVVGVVSVAPFIALISRPQLVHEQRYAQLVYDYFGFETDLGFLTAFAIALMVVITITNAVPAVMTWLVWRFAKTLGAELQVDIFRGYIHGDLAKLARVNSAQMVNLIVHGVNRLVYSVMQPLLTLLSSAFVIVLITLTLIVVAPVVALSAGAIIGGGYALVYLFTRSRLARHGKLVWKATEEKQQLLSEALGGLKEIRLAGTAAQYENRLDTITDRALSSEAMIGLYGELPRYVLEAIALCSLLALGIILLHRSEDWSGAVAILSLYAMAGYRLLPASQAVFRSASLIRSNTDAVDDLREALSIGRSIQDDSHNHASVDFPLDGDIRFEEVDYRYPESSGRVIESLSFAIQRNSITAVVGMSGAGKSTAADLLMGLLPAERGRISVGGIDIALARREWQRHVSFVSQSVFIVDDTIRANIAFGSLDEIDEKRLVRAARMANVAHFADHLPEGYDYVVGENGSLLSGGQRQRIGIARALYNDASVIVMDEPTSALDSVTERDIIATLESLRSTKTIILITHRLSTLRSADKVILLDRGRVSGVGSFDHMMASSAAFRVLVAAEDGPNADGQ
jgi:ABC-type multidrug transport system fused ATPase/permease subunit